MARSQRYGGVARIGVAWLALMHGGVLGHDSIEHKCIHDQIVEQLEATAPDEALQAATLHLNARGDARYAAERQQRRRGLRQDNSGAGTAAPLRMAAEYMFEDAEGSDRWQEALQEAVMPEAMRALSRALKVRVPLEGPFTVPQDCASTVGDGTCASVRPADCAGFMTNPISDSLLGDITLCDGNGCTDIPGGPGLNDTDFLAVVTAKGTESCGTTTLAYAVTCSRDLANRYGVQNRPLVGHINFCPRSLDLQQDQAAFERTLDVAVHELLHSIFFSSSNYRFYVNEDGSAKENVVRMSSDGPPAIVTESVVKEVAAHFGCSSDEVAGGLLEGNGASSTAGSHWEAVSLYGEMMIGTAVDRRMVLSNVTLALAEDSGWYLSNRKAAGFLAHGYQAGCDLLKECTAVGPDSEAAEYFCDAAAPTGAQRCVENDQIATCQEHTLSDCMLALTNRKSACKTPTNMELVFGSSTTSLGAYYGPSGICMNVPDGAIWRGFRRSFQDALCVAAECVDGGTKVNILIPQLFSGGFDKYECPPGEMLQLRKRDGFAPGSEIGPCPIPEEVCKTFGCPVRDGLTCSGKGTCYEGKCFCDIGAAGPDCNEALCVKDDQCLDGQFCDLEMMACTWPDGEGPPLPSAIGGGEPWVAPEKPPYQPMRAVRVGYMRSCTFFNDADQNGNWSDGERHALSGELGEVSLYEINESLERTLYDIRMTNYDSTANVAQAGFGCQDTLSERVKPRLLFRAATGIATEGAYVTFFSTATALNMLAKNVGRAEAAPEIADKFNVGLAFVHERDWVQMLVDRDRSASEYKDAAKAMQVSTVMVLTAETVAAMAPWAPAPALADEVVLQLVERLDGQKQATAWVTDVAFVQDLLQDVLQSAAARAIALSEGAISALAKAIVTTNTLIVDRVESAGKLTEMGAAELVERVAQLAFAAEDIVAPAAAALANGSMTVDQFESATAKQQLTKAADSHEVDLSSATNREEQTFFGQLSSAVSNWFNTEHAGLFGWAWVLLICIVAVLCAVVGCFYRRRRKRQLAANADANVEAKLERSPEPNKDFAASKEEARLAEKGGNVPRDQSYTKEMYPTTREHHANGDVTTTDITGTTFPAGQTACIPETLPFAPDSSNGASRLALSNQR